MNLDILLWIGGTLFSLGIFAVKVGLGIGYGQIGARSTGVILVGYIVLFMIMAFLSDKLTGILWPILNKGPYLHMLMATGMIAWGLYTLRDSGRMSDVQEGAGQKMRLSSLLLIIPCPVCLTAMAFSTWSAVAVLKLPAVLVGGAMGVIFAVLSLLFMILTRFGRSDYPEVSLGLTMTTVGLYFFASLVLPAKIEEAKGVYASLNGNGSMMNHADSIGVLLILFAALFIGYIRKQKEYK